MKKPAPWWWDATAPAGQKVIDREAATNWVLDLMDKDPEVERIVMEKDFNFMGGVRH